MKKIIIQEKKNMTQNIGNAKINAAVDLLIEGDINLTPTMYKKSTAYLMILLYSVLFYFKKVFQ